MPGTQWGSCGFYEEEIFKDQSQKCLLTSVVTEPKQATFVWSCLNGHVGIMKKTVMRFSACQWSLTHSVSF